MAVEIKIGLIGAGFIGRSHALAISAVNGVFGDGSLTAIPEILAELEEDTARQVATRYGFRSWTTDWKKAIDASDAVIIAVPSFRHEEIAMYAIAKGKHILCEKPVGLSANDTLKIAKAASEEGICNCVGFTYARSPMIRHAKKLLEDGTLGAPLHFRGRHCEDYLASSDEPFSWRLDASLAGRSGALGDLGWHIISVARYLCGAIETLSANTKTFHKERKVGSDQSKRRTVENEDWAGLLLEFASGATGVLEVSRIAHGRKMDIGFELVCENGTIAVDGERLNELQVYVSGTNASADGFKTIQINKNHPDYAAFIPAPGHGLGFNDLKTIELRDFLVAIKNQENAYPDLDEAHKIACVCEAAIESSNQRNWISAPESFEL